MILLGRRYNRQKKQRGERGAEKTGHFVPSDGHVTAESLAVEHGVDERIGRRSPGSLESRKHEIFVIRKCGNWR